MVRLETSHSTDFMLLPERSKVVSLVRVVKSHGNMESLFILRSRKVSMVRLDRSHSTDIMSLAERCKVVSWVRVVSSHGNMESLVAARVR